MYVWVSVLIKFAHSPLGLSLILYFVQYDPEKELNDLIVYKSDNLL